MTQAERMDDYVKEACSIVRGQASVREMDHEEIVDMVTKVADGLRGISHSNGNGNGNGKQHGLAVLGVGSSLQERAIADDHIVCLECGRKMRVINSQHLASHGLSAKQYREKHGYPPDQPLACKDLSTKRRASMCERRVWERRGKKKKK